MRQPRILVAITLLLAFGALGAAGWVLLDEPAPVPDAPPAAGDGSAGEREESDWPVAAHAAEGWLAPDPDRGLDVPVIERLSGPVEEGVGPTLVVTERETGRPLPDAAVRLVARDCATDEEWDRLLGHDPGLDPWIEEHGDPVGLDALGTAALPWRPLEAIVVAEAGDRRGRRALRLDSGERVLLRLVRREKLTLLALDPDGRPQRDVPLSLQSIRRGDPWRGPARLLWSGSADPDGRAILAQGGELLSRHLDADGLASEAVVVATLAFVCRDPSPALIDPRTGCARPAVVVTPPRSTLRLRAEGEPGEPFAGDVELFAALDGRTRDAIPVQRVWPATIPAGRTIELTVEAGAPVRLDARSRDGRFEAARTTVTAPPRAESADVTLRLRTRPEPPCCRLLVVDASGAPFEAGEVRWQLAAHSAERPFRPELLAPDPGRIRAARAAPDGALSIETALLAEFVARNSGGPRSDRGRRNPADRSVECRLELFVGLDAPRVTGARHASALRLPPIQPTDELDLGTIVLAEVPLLAGGRAVDREGNGISDVEVRVTESREKPRSWRALTDREGRFAIHSTSTTPALEVWPSRDRWHREGEFQDGGAAVPLRVAAGAGDVEFTLRRNGWAHGRLLVDPGISRHGLALTALPQPARDVRFELAEDGRFLVHGPPGPRTLAVLSKLGHPDPIASIAGFRFEEGEETVDPRIDPIDLRRDLRQVELAVSDGDGGPIARALLRLVSGQDRILAVERTTDPFGRAVVTTPVSGSWLILGTPRHRFRSVRFEPSFQEIELAPAAVVRVRVEGPAERLLQTRGFGPTLTLSVAADGREFLEAWKELPAAGARRVDATTFELRAPVNGDYRLVWKRRPQDPDRDAVAGPRGVTVGLRDSAVEVVEKWSAEDVARISRRLGR